MCVSVGWWDGRLDECSTLLCDVERGESTHRKLIGGMAGWGLSKNMPKSMESPADAGSMKQFRRIATRYDKLASRFSAFIAIVASFIWLA